MNPPFEVGNLWLVVLNIGLWGFLQFGLAKIMVSLPAGWFKPGHRVYKIWGWEDSGRFWQRRFLVQKWKHLLPSGARMTGGFSMERISTRKTDHLDRYLLETCRAEATHSIALLLIPLFALFNPVWAMPIHLAYGLCSNIPCWMVQRVNRAKVSRILGRPWG